MTLSCTLVCPALLPFRTAIMSLVGKRMLMPKYKNQRPIKRRISFNCRSSFSIGLFAFLIESGLVFVSVFPGDGSRGEGVHVVDVVPRHKHHPAPRSRWQSQILNNWFADFGSSILRIFFYKQCSQILQKITVKYIVYLLYWKQCCGPRAFWCRSGSGFFFGSFFVICLTKDKINKQLNMQKTELSVCKTD